MEILREYSDVVEQYSIDEAFMDMTATCHLFGTAEETADEIRERIHRELGFTVNIGISENKLLAKMASDLQKPDKVHTLYPEEIEKKMWPLPVSELFFVGRATAKKLFSMGIRTIGELAETDPALLKSMLKKQGEVIWGFANGIDYSPVLSENPASPVSVDTGLSRHSSSICASTDTFLIARGKKGYGNSTTTPYDVTYIITAKKVLLALAETVGTRLRRDKVRIEVVSVGIKNSDLSYASHQKILQTQTNLTAEIYDAACDLFTELWNGKPIRHLGIHTSRVQAGDFTRQLCLFDEVDYEKLGKLDETVDAIRKRYGIDSVKRAIFLRQPDGKMIDHMSGGISREKRTVDYSRIKIG